MRTATLLGVSILLSATAAQAAPDGAALFSQNCAACHQADGSGSPGQAPPLKDRVDKIAGTQEGRAFLADVLTHGLSGPIDAGGDSFSGFMPAFRQLDDASIAAILTWVSAQGATKPAPEIAASDVAAARARTLTANAVHQERQTLAAHSPLP